MKTAVVRLLSLFALVLAIPWFAAAQDFRGRINGTVTDNTGAVLPGVTVTASSPALIQPRSCDSTPSLWRRHSAAAADCA